MQRLEPISFIDGNFWQLKDRSGEGNSGLHSGVVSSAMSSVSSVNEVHVKNESACRLVLGIPRSGLVAGSFLNDTIPWRQRGHGMDPGGPWVAAVVALVVEQRYNAHRVQNS